MDTYLALKTTLKVSLYSYLNPAKSGQIMNINTGNLFVFEVGLSVKFKLRSRQLPISTKISFSAQPLKLALHENPGMHGNWIVIFLHESKKAPFWHE